MIILSEAEPQEDKMDALARWFDPGLQSLMELDSFFRDVFEDLESYNGICAFAPRTSVWDGEEESCLELDLPGMKQEDIKIEINDSILAISGERKREEKGGKWIKEGIVFGRFTRSYVLPERVEANQISATYQDGVLRVRIPKKNKKPEIINISVGESKKLGEGTQKE